MSQSIVFTTTITTATLQLLSSPTPALSQTPQSGGDDSFSNDIHKQLVDTSTLSLFLNLSLSLSHTLSTLNHIQHTIDCSIGLDYTADLT